MALLSDPIFNRHCHTLDGTSVGQLADRSHPESYLDLGLLLRQVRGRRSLRRVAQECGIRSSSALNRYENGVPLPADVAEALDSYYGLDGRLSDSVARIELTSARPWSPSDSAQFFVHRWAPSHQGQVWIALIPGPASALRPYEVDLHWGPWSQSLRLQVPVDGMALTTGKSIDHDGVAVSFHLRVNQRIRAAFGIDVPPLHLQIRDISRGWTRTAAT